MQCYILIYINLKEVHLWQIRRFFKHVDAFLIFAENYKLHEWNCILRRETKFLWKFRKFYSLSINKFIRWIKGYNRCMRHFTYEYRWNDDKSKAY